MQSDRIYWRTPAYRAAVAHPYHVSAWSGWQDHEPTTVGFQSEAEARRFASLRPEPLIDLVARDAGRVIACRRMLPFVAPLIEPFVGRDDFPDTRPMSCEPGECIPVDICGACRATIRVANGRAWHAIAAVVLAGAAPDHEPTPQVECLYCGTPAEPVGPDELAEAWGDMLASRPVKGQTSWL